MPEKEAINFLKEIGYTGYVHFTDTFGDYSGELQVAIVGNAFDNKEIMKGSNK